jgi:hypothetical protein
MFPLRQRLEVMPLHRLDCTFRRLIAWAGFNSPMTLAIRELQNSWACLYPLANKISHG